ncbi:MAG: protein phosphatase 2C domain-containing protein [Gemmataceae bacterium]
MPPSAAIRFASLTDVGVKRSHNQDACAVQPAADPSVWRAQGHVFIVADGMGGHAVGEKASAKAVRDIPLTYLKHVVQEGVPAAVRRAFTEANQSIHAIGLNNPEFKGLGTTGTALFLRPEGAWVGHVGDSRAYRVRGGRVHQLTFDHSWVWEVARRQGIDPDELGDFKRNVIIRSLGPDSDVEVDIEGPHPVEPGDVFLLCSDGLSNVVGPDEIGAVVTAFGPEDACRYLVNLANLRGGPDNITCLIAVVPDGSANGKAAGGGGVLAAIDRVVPWPFAALGLGAVLAGVSVWLQMAEAKAVAIPAFVAAAGLILGGLVGLYSYLRKRTEEADTQAAEPPAELHLYRDYGFVVGKELYDKFTILHVGVRDAVKERNLAVDWPAHDNQAAAAEAAAAKGDWTTAFRDRFVALQAVATAYHKHLAKDETFRPNWMPHDKPAGGSKD